MLNLWSEDMKLTNTSTASQRALIKALLRERPHSTLELRAKGICSPAPRIMELKKQGHEIITSTRAEIDQSGIKHNGIAVYTLLSEPQQEQGNKTTGN